MHRIILIILIVLVCTSCDDREQIKLVEVSNQAEKFLSLLRNENWDEAADSVLIDENAMARLALPNGADRNLVLSKIIMLFRKSFKYQKPGDIVYVGLDPYHKEDTNIAFIQYYHGDLNGMYMRFENGRWLLSFE